MADAHESAPGLSLWPVFSGLVVNDRQLTRRCSGREVHVHLGNRFTAVVAVYASLVLLAGCGAPTRVYHPTADEIRDETGFDEGSSIRPTLSPTGSDQDRERHDAKRHSRASAPTEEAARRVAVANVRWQAIAGN